MKPKACPTTKKLLTCFVAVLLALGVPANYVVKSQSLLGGTTQLTQDLEAGLRVSNDLVELLFQGKLGERADVIVQSQGPWSSTLDMLILILGGRVKQTYGNLNMRAVDMPLASVLQLAASLQVAYISTDRKIGLLGHVAATSGAESVNPSDAGDIGLDGTGIGIAIVDSGIYSAHRSFQGKTNNSRVVVAKDFTGEGRTDDPYGHGSHVAAIAAGNSKVSTGAYLGIAPNANLINLRVLNSQGTGSTSRLLKALDWVISNRSTFNIRVVNLSLGAAAIDSYKNDPICKAVRRLVDSGIVVVAAAGNNGQNTAGQKTYGQIHSPGNEPSAITVGASNSFGTDSRSDDSITSYSSRGPTRSYWTDAHNVRHYDNLIKPDIVAPGNKIISAQAVNNLLVNQHPELDVAVSSVDTRKMMRLSGTSMSTPVTAGAAALVLQANPKLSPNLVKAILMYSSQPLAGYNMFEQGAGQINIEGAVRLARLIRTDISDSTLLGTALLTGNVPQPQTTISGYSFTWSQGLVLSHTYATGTNLIILYQKIYGRGFLLGDGVIAGDGVTAGDLRMITNGIELGENVMISNGVIAGDGSVFCSTSLLLSDGALFDGQILGDGVIAGDKAGVIAGDTQFCGDNTASMSAPPDGGG